MSFPSRPERFRVHPVIYAMGAESSSTRDKTARAWGITHLYLECIEPYLHAPYTSSWPSASVQEQKSRFKWNIYKNLSNCYRGRFKLYILSCRDVAYQQQLDCSRSLLNAIQQNVGLVGGSTSEGERMLEHLYMYSEKDDLWVDGGNRPWCPLITGPSVPNAPQHHAGVGWLILVQCQQTPAHEKICFFTILTSCKQNHTIINFTVCTLHVVLFRAIK